MIQRWLQAVAKPFLFLAIIGLLSCLVVHLCGLMGFPSPLGTWTWILVPGLFVVWFPTILYASRLARDFKQRDFWKAVLRGCPPWLRCSVYVFIAYGVVNFIHIALDRRGSPDPTGPASPETAWAVTGHLMIFYSVAAAVLYSATRVVAQPTELRCPGGHVVSVLANYCEQCGVRVDRDSVS